MIVRFVGGPANGTVRDVSPGVTSAHVPHLTLDVHRKLFESSSNCKETLDIKVAIYDLDHVTIDGEEWNVFVYRSSK